MMIVNSKGCKDCINVKRAFIILKAMEFKNVRMVCSSCDTIWTDEDIENDKQNIN
jgi:hypothetical protein